MIRETIGEVAVYNLMLSAKQDPEKYEFYETGDHVKIYVNGIYKYDCDKELFFTQYHKLFPSIKNCGFFDRSSFKNYF